MAEVRPLRGLRYQSSVVGDLSAVIAPPYDVISAETQSALYDKGPYNVVRLEFGSEAGPRRYEAAAETLSQWISERALARDSEPSFYLYEQVFAYGGREFRRRSIIGRVRLEPWDAGVILPHEHTLAGPKQDRLQLLEACRTNVSPVFGLYRPDGDDLVAACITEAAGAPAVDAVDIAGHHHRLWPLAGAVLGKRITDHFARKRIYIADGHHRYETALAYRDARRSASSAWTGEEPENFVLMALTSADDPGLLILPIHRMVRANSPGPGLREALAGNFTIDPFEDSAPDAMLTRLNGERGRQTAFGCLAADSAPMLITLRDRNRAETSMPEGHSSAWRRLDVNVLQFAIFEPLLGIDLEAVRAGDSVEFTESAGEAQDAVQAKRFPLAFLLNGTTAEEIFAVADAGDRMPQKSTYFYPKLGTGLVLYALSD
jgi:uncharacterized protein (DUF1015 family)